MSLPDALDYAWGRPDPNVLAASGVRLACRYLSYDSSKNLSGNEAATLHAAGVGVLLNWESDAGRPLLGAAAGTQDGLAAAALAETIGAPHGLTIYYSCDRDISSDEYGAIDAYYSAAASATAGRYLVGVYGEADLVDHLYGHSLVTSYWQTLAWSGGRVSVYADLYQYAINQTMAGAAVDFDQILHPDQLGAWWPQGVSPSGGGQPIPVPAPDEDDDMPKALHLTDYTDPANPVTYIAAYDLSSKTQVVSATDEQNFKALINLGVYQEAAMTPAQIAAIPTAK